jgi:hypothetical protein
LHGRSSIFYNESKQSINAQNRLNNGAAMTITLELPKELENELSQEADMLGLSLPDYTLRLLFLRPALEAVPKTGAELVTYWRNAGVIGTRPDVTDSQQHARQVRAKAEKRTAK